jgi:hypothetical protein
MMKKWIVSILMVVFVAGNSSAAWWPFGSDKQDEEPFKTEQVRQRQQGDHMERKKDQYRQKMSEEQRAKKKAEYKAIHRLAENARLVIDPAKKAELTGQLRVKLTENAERKQEEFRKRLEKAEADVVKMRERLEKGEADMEQRIEEHLQELLSGEKPERRGGKGKGVEGERRKGPPPSE